MIKRWLISSITDMTKGLTWREHFSVGHTGLDAEHRSMIDAVNAICECEHARSGDVDLSARYGTLRILSSKHFEHEGLVLKAIQSFGLTEPSFPVSIEGISEAVLDEHLHDHSEAFDALNSHISRSQEMGAALCEELTSWFVSHAVKYDAHLKALFQGIESDCPDLLRRLP